jgi:hypothetical protein
MSIVGHDGHGDERGGGETPHLHLLLAVLWAMAMAMAMALSLDKERRQQDLLRIRKRDSQKLRRTWNSSKISLNSSKVSLKSSKVSLLRFSCS